MTKIVFVYEAVFPESKGGIERWFKTLSEALAQKNFEVIYLNSQEIHGYRNGVKYISLQGSSWTYKQGGVRSISQTLSFSLKVFNWLRRNEHDFIYGSNVPIIPIFAIGLSRIFSNCSFLVEWFEIWPIKYWIRYLGFIKGLIGWFLQFIAIQIGGYRIVYTERVLHGLKKKSFFSKTMNIKLLSGLCDSRNEIELELFNINRNDVVFVGRFVAEKQPNLAIETIAKLVELPWTGHFWLIGSGPLQFDLVNKVRSLGLEKRITILNDVTDSVVKEKMLKSFALLHPSRREGYGLAVIEAAYRGTPSVMINYPDNAAVDLEILPELVIQDDSVDSLAQMLWNTHQNQAALRDKLSYWIMTASRSKSIDQSINEISVLCRKS